MAAANVLEMESEEIGALVLGCGCNVCFKGRDVCSNGGGSGGGGGGGGDTCNTDGLDVVDFCGVGLCGEDGDAEAERWSSSLLSESLVLYSS